MDKQVKLVEKENQELKEKLEKAYYDQHELENLVEESKVLLNSKDE